jgi:RNA polymerase sigma factor (sigma-70 family)
MRTVLARYQIPPEEAEELAQTTYLEALEQAARIRHPVAWMIGRLRHHCLEHRRKGYRLRRRQVSLDTGMGEAGRRVALHQPVVEDGAEAVERRLYLLSLLRTLPVKLRVLLVERYLYGRVDHEVAKKVGLATSSVRRRRVGRWRGRERRRGGWGGRRGVRGRPTGSVIALIRDRLGSLDRTVPGRRSCANYTQDRRIAPKGMGRARSSGAARGPTNTASRRSRRTLRRCR